MSWSDGHLTQAVIHSKSGVPCNIVYGEKHWEFETEAGKSYPLTRANKYASQANEQFMTV